MKKIRSTIWFPAVLSMLLCLSVLAGCTQSSGADTQPPAAQTAAAETTVSAEELSLAKCRAALEDIQSYEHYEVYSANQFEGENALNDSSNTRYWRHGEDRMYVTRIPEDGPAGCTIVAMLCKDGEKYSGIIDEAENDVLWYDEITWPELIGAGPWLYNFDWDAQEVQHVSTISESSGQSIRIQVLGPYAGSEISVESYTAEFYFDPDNRFEKVVLVTYDTKSGIRARYTESIVTTDGNVVAAEIDRQHQRALKHCAE